MVVTTTKDLGEAIKRNEFTIIIEGDLAARVIRIKMTGPLAWAVAAAAIGAAVYLYLATPAATVASAPAGGAGGAISFTGATGAAAAATTVLGINATAAAIGIAVAAGGVGSVVALRDKYKIAERSSKRVVLKRK